MSQLDLAMEAGISTRHLSFLETGRSMPTVGMVLRLAEALALPLRERNTLLGAAGFAPRYRERSLSDESMVAVRRALGLVLKSHEPYPAFVLDPMWNILLANRPFLAMLGPDRSGAPSDGPINVLRLVLHPAMLKPQIENWEIVAHVLMKRVQRKLRVPEPNQGLKMLFDELIGYPGVAEAMQTDCAPEAAEVLIPLTIGTGEARLSWFTTLATIGTPQDVTLEELMIESLFPADEETERRVRAMADREAAE